MGMNRKIRKNAQKSTNIIDNIDLDFLKAGLGLSERVEVVAGAYTSKPDIMFPLFN